MKQREIIRFADILRSIDRIDASGRAFLARLDKAEPKRPLVPVARAAIEHAAGDLVSVIDQETPFVQPRDMTEDEWAQPEIVLLRAAIDTLGLAAAQRPKDFRDWMRDARLALVEFDEAMARFRAAVEV